MTEDPQTRDSGKSQQSQAEDLARRYLDLWQDEMSALASEPLPGPAGQKIVDSCVDLSQAGLAWTETLVSLTRQTAKPEGTDATQALLKQGLALSEQWQDMLQKTWSSAWPSTSMGGNRPPTQRPGGKSDDDLTEESQAGGDKAQETASPGPRHESKKGNLNHDTTGTPASSAAPERGRRDLEQLARRLALLEERLAAYEAGSEEEGGGSGS